MTLFESPGKPTANALRLSGIWVDNSEGSPFVNVGSHFEVL